MIKSKVNSKENKYIQSARLCLKNAERLMYEAQWMETLAPPASRYYLSVIAQEECAKGFLLYLVSDKIIPWNSFVLRASRDHKCKQLLCLVIDFLAPDIDEFIRRTNMVVLEKKPPEFPSRIQDALAILRHEKIGRWESNAWVWAEDPKYDEAALEVCEGKRDFEKQQSLYVEISKDGHATATPWQITEEQVNKECECADRFISFLGFLKTGEPPNALDYEIVENTIRMLFDSVEYPILEKRSQNG